MEAIFHKHLCALRPTDAQGMEALNRLKPDQQVRVEIKTLRNPRQFRLYWALMGMLAGYADSPCTSKDVDRWMKIAVGHSEVRHYPDGTTQVEPKSIAFGNLSQDKWQDFFDKVIDVATTKILHGTTNEDLKAELEDMIAPRRAA